MNDLFGDVVYSYSRNEAIADGELIDVSEVAGEAGFKIPVALTRAVWVDCVEWDDSLNGKKNIFQDQDGRLWDVVYMALIAAKRSGNQSTIEYRIYRVPVVGRGRLPRRVDLMMRIHGGDDGEPVITISFPRED